MLASESRAYGFTIAFWGSGTMLINSHGLPGLEQALLYGFGAVLGFGALSVLTFRGTEKIDYDRPDIAVLGMVHYLAALVPIALSSLITSLSIAVWVQFFLSGFLVSSVYNILAVLEEGLAELVENFSP
jgi:hypothetical protein